MNMNINENELKHATFEESITDDVYSGLHSVLFRRINNVSITNPCIKDAFASFVKDVECGKTFSVAELLYSSEALLKKGEINENAGNLIYCYDHSKFFVGRAATKMLKNSVSGIYALMAIHNGVAIEISAAGGSLAAAETKRFVIIPPKKEDAFVKEALRNGIQLTKCGSVLSNNRIILTLNGATVADIDKTKIDSESEAMSISLGQEHFSAFLSGYNAVCSIALCNCVADNNIVRFGLGCDLAAACARALGFYAAAMFLKLVPIRTVFTSDNTATVAVPRPNVTDGDYLYLLKLRNDPNGLPEKGHYGQLFYYLSEKKRMGIIKDVLPMRENINKTIGRLCGNNLEYVPLSQAPDDCFAVIVSVGRGESVNGIKLGYFKNI